MRELVSSDLPAGYTGAITADQINRLREDLLKGHDHASGRGGAIHHDWLDEDDGQPIPGTALLHSIINNHLQGTGTSGSPDAGGGTHGVHGLPSGIYVFGVGARQFCIQVGTSDAGSNRSTEEPSGSGLYTFRARGTYYRAFSEAPYVLTCCTEAQAATTSVYQTLKTSVAAKMRFRSESSWTQDPNSEPKFNWIAFGYIERDAYETDPG